MHRKLPFTSLVWCCLVGLVLFIGSGELRAQPQATVPLPIDTIGEQLIKQAVLDQVMLLHRAILNRDSIAIDALLDNDISYIHSNGLTQTKAEVIRSVVSRQHDYSKIHPRRTEVRIIAHSAVVDMDADVSLVLEGKPLELDLHINQVWMKQSDGSWKLVTRQSTRNPTPH